MPPAVEAWTLQGRPLKVDTYMSSIDMKTDLRGDPAEILFLWADTCSQRSLLSGTVASPSLSSWLIRLLLDTQAERGPTF